MTCAFQLAYYRQKLPAGLLAVVRYTMYDDNGKISNVDTLEYGISKEQTETFQMQVITALECGIDVAIMTRHSMKRFKKLHDLVT